MILNAFGKGGEINKKKITLCMHEWVYDYRI